MAKTKVDPLAALETKLTNSDSGERQTAEQIAEHMKKRDETKSDPSPAEAGSGLGKDK